MAVSKVERLMNLVIALLSTRGYITAEKIRSSVAGYADSATDEAFSRMFERDKNELRDLGIPLETGKVSSFDPVEGYRINRDAYALPAVELTADEAAAVAVATQLWESPELITATQGALLKLRAAGVDVDADAPVAIASPAGTLGLRGAEDVLGALLPAIDSGQAVQFPHRPSRDRAVHRAHGRAVGCGDREGPLVSRRARSRPRRHPHIPAVPDRWRGHTDRAGRGRHQAQGRRPAPDRGRRGRRNAVRRTCSGLGGARDGPPRCGAPGHRWSLGRWSGRDGDVIELDIGTTDRLARDIAGYGADALVLDPSSLREEVLGRLRAHAGDDAADRSDDEERRL